MTSRHFHNLHPPEPQDRLVIRELEKRGSGKVKFFCTWQLKALMIAGNAFLDHHKDPEEAVKVLGKAKKVGASCTQRRPGGGGGAATGRPHACVRAHACACAHLHIHARAHTHTHTQVHDEYMADFSKAEAKAMERTLAELQNLRAKALKVNKSRAKKEQGRWSKAMKKIEREPEIVPEKRWAGLAT